MFTRHERVDKQNDQVTQPNRQQEPCLCPSKNPWDCAQCVNTTIGTTLRRAAADVPEIQRLMIIPCGVACCLTFHPKNIIWEKLGSLVCKPARPAIAIQELKPSGTLLTVLNHTNSDLLNYCSCTTKPIDRANNRKVSRERATRWQPSRISPHTTLIPHPHTMLEHHLSQLRGGREGVEELDKNLTLANQATWPSLWRTGQICARIYYDIHQYTISIHTIIVFANWSGASLSLPMSGCIPPHCWRLSSGSGLQRHPTAPVLASGCSRVGNAPRCHVGKINDVIGA